jgi:hypothetical protein
MEQMLQRTYQSLGQKPAAALPLSLAGRRSAAAADPQPALGVISPESSEHSYGLSAIDDALSFTEAPVVKFLQDTLVEECEGQLPRSLNGSAARFSLSPIQHLIPDGRSLRCILETTERYWTIWPLGMNEVPGEKPCFPCTVPDALSFVEESLRSGTRGAVAKCLVWLTICIQQLPKDFEETTARLPLRPCDLISHYLNVVDSLTLSNAPPACDLECIEALVLQYKVFVNMGRPQRAWKCTRSALDSALLLGLHRATGDDYDSRRKSRLWTAIWQHDRHLAVFLGLPYTVPEQYIRPPGPSNAGEVPAEQLFFHHLNIICGLIVDRDQLHQQSSFSATARIVEEMDKLEKLIPEGWAKSSMDDRSIPLGVSFWRQVAILFFHCVNQQVHLPYVKAAAEDKRHEYSRCAAIQSAEFTMRTYHGVRAMMGVPVICELLDFFAVSACLVLATDLSLGMTPRSPDEEDRIWGLISQFIQDMRHVASLLDCAVIEQSVEIMEYIYAAHHGTYTGPDNFEATIPFFGRMQIRSPKKAAISAVDAPTCGDSSIGHGAIEINTNAFNFRLPADFQSPYELGDDWTVDLNFDGNYDWNGIFEFK